MKCFIDRVSGELLHLLLHFRPLAGVFLAQLDLVRLLRPRRHLARQVPHRRSRLHAPQDAVGREGEAVGLECRSKRAWVCFTYIKGHHLTQVELLPVVAVLVYYTVVQVDDYATSGAL